MRPMLPTSVSATRSSDGALASRPRRSARSRDSKPLPGEVDEDPRVVAGGLAGRDGGCEAGAERLGAEGEGQAIEGCLKQLLVLPDLLGRVAAPVEPLVVVRCSDPEGIDKLTGKGIARRGEDATTRAAGHGASACESGTIPGAAVCASMVGMGPVSVDVGPVAMSGACTDGGSVSGLPSRLAW